MYRQEAALHKGIITAPDLLSGAFLCTVPVSVAQAARLVGVPGFAGKMLVGTIGMQKLPLHMVGYFFGVFAYFLLLVADMVVPGEYYFGPNGNADWYKQEAALVCLKRFLEVFILIYMTGRLRGMHGSPVHTNGKLTHVAVTVLYVTG